MKNVESLPLDKQDFPGVTSIQLIIKKMYLPFVLCIILLFPEAVWTQEVTAPSEQPVLTKAVMCESIQKFSPENEAVVFSIELGRVYCYTEFDPVPKQSVIYHRWYHRGSLISVKQLTVNPPHWSSFSSMQLRDADKGPWQVDITDDDGNILKTLRFSITD